MAINHQRYLFKDHFAYLSCGFGIVILDLDRQEINDTWDIGPNAPVLTSMALLPTVPILCCY